MKRTVRRYEHLRIRDGRLHVGPVLSDSAWGPWRRRLEHLRQLGRRLAARR